MNDSWWSMGGYAVYVWSSFGLAGVVLVGGLVLSWAGLCRQQHEIRLEQEDDDA